MSYYMGVDVGTFETKGALVAENGRLVATASTAHRMDVPRPGWAEHDAEADWWGDFRKVVAKLLAGGGVRPEDIRAVACSAIGPCMLPVDADGAPLSKAVLYGVDTRAAAEVAELTAEIGEARLVAETGQSLTSQSVGPKILWLKRNRPEVWARTRHVVTSTSFLVRRLTGETVIDHYTAASFGPLYDPARLDWTEALAPGLIDRDMLPRLGWATDIAGTVTAEAAAATGLAVGTPVTIGTIDAAAEALSVGVRRPGDAMLMYGSTVFLIGLTEAPVRDARLWAAPWLYPGRHATMAGLATSGTLTHWFRDHLAQDLDPETAFERLLAEAQAVPEGAGGLVALPYFSGERTPIHDPLAKGVIFGLNLTHGRGHVYRALLEGIACGTAHAMEAMAEAGARPERVLAVGGGVQNPVWLQATSDFADVDQIVAMRTMGASYGDAFAAALALGDARVEDIDVWNPEARRIAAAQTDLHRRHYGVFKDLYVRTRDLMATLG